MREIGQEKKEIENKKQISKWKDKTKPKFNINKERNVKIDESRVVLVLDKIDLIENKISSKEEIIDHNKDLNHSSNRS